MRTNLTSDLHVLKNRLSLRALAEEAGAGFHGGASRCPLHRGDNPTAFHLYDGDRRWHCFTRCPDGSNDGDIFGFYMRWKNVDFKAALDDLTARLGSPTTPTETSNHSNRLVQISENSRIPFPTPLWTSRAQAFIDYAVTNLHHPLTGIRARAYLFSERGLKPATWDIFQLGYNPETVYDSPAAWGLEGERRIWLPRGIVIPGFRCNQPRSIKVRRPLPGDLLSGYIPCDDCRPSHRTTPPLYPNSLSPAPQPKFGGPRGGHATLFGADLWLQFPVLLLVEGEWDAMLAWQAAGDLVDVATLGGAGRRAHLDDLAALACYPLVLAVYDADPAGDRGREYLRGLPRVESLPPPDHDLSDYWRGGRDLRAWIAARLNRRLPGLHAALRPQLRDDAKIEWELLELAVAEEAGESGSLTSLNL